MISSDWDLYAGLSRVWQLRKEVRELEESGTSTAQPSSERLAEIERLREELRSYLRSSGPRVPAHPLRVEFDVPLYEALWSLEPRILELVPSQWNKSLDPLGFMFRRSNNLCDGGYSCTPINSLKFGSTGGDGEHFNFLVQDGRIDSQSPIVFTNQSADPPYNWIVGRNLHQFMQFGLARGFQALARVSPNSLRNVFNNPDWRPTKTWEECYLPREHQLPVLRLVAESLNIEPRVYTPDEFQAMQDELMPRLRYSLDEIFERDHYGELDMQKKRGKWIV